MTEPSGDVLSYRNRQTRSGGQLDRDANSSCSVRPPTVENVHWGDAPPRGTYRVVLRAYSMCGAPSAAATISIAVGGRVVGTYSYTFTRDGEEFALPLTI